MFDSILVFIFVLALSPSVTAVSADATCFSINGQSNTDFPCFLGQSVSACCGTNSICLDNGLCKPVNSVGVSELIRGSCTDKTWLSPSCPDYCIGATLGGTNLISCQNVTNSQSDFCCDHTTDCCDSGIGRFRVPGAFTAVVTVGSTAVSVTKTQPGTASTTSTSTTSSKVTTTASSKSSTTQPSSSDKSASSASSSLGASESTSSPSPTPNPETTKKSTPVVSIAVGVTIGGVAIIVAAAVWYFLRKRKRTKSQYQDFGSYSGASELPSASTSPLDGKYRAQASTARHEVDGIGRPAEMETRYHPVYELPAMGYEGRRA